MKYSLLIFLLLLFYLAIPSEAQHFTSSSYIIDWGNFNITSGSKTSSNYALTDTVGQNAPGQYNSTGFVVKSGFQYIYDTFNVFSFSIDNLNMALGTLTAGVASTNTNIISVNTPSGRGYQIMALQNHPLTNLQAGITIPNTSCNVGSTCTVSSSNVWNSSTAYGFGFNVIGINNSLVVTNVGTSDYFADASNYRPFSSQTAEIIMSENSATKNPTASHKARVTYKVNIGGFQASGNYQNAITFIAVPRY